MERPCFIEKWKFNSVLNLRSLWILVPSVVQVFINELSFHIRHASGASLFSLWLALFLYYGNI